MPTHYAGTPEETLALDTFIKLTRAADSVTTRLHRMGTIGDLTPSQFGVLESLYHLGSMSQSEIGAKLLKSSGNITLVITNLEKQDLVRRQRDPGDRRVVTVSLTEAGHELVRRIFPDHVSAIVEQMSVLTPQEQATLGDLCRKLGKQEKK
jgi:MarR family 2-MHQ and catechol resistance regulon transcriptional repressor